MKNFGFKRVASCSPEVRPGDVTFNIANISNAIERCISEQVELVVFPELCITGYTCGDLFGQSLLLDAAISGLYEIAKNFRNETISIVVGAPLRNSGSLYNCAVVIKNGAIQGIVPKSYIPNYGEFYEKRWFRDANGIQSEQIRLTEASTDLTREYPFGTDLLFDSNGVKFGIEICEDLWVPVPPSSYLTVGGADIICNLSASDELIGKHAYTLDLIRNQSARCRCCYIYSSAGLGESSTDLAFAGNCIIAENGKIMAESERFQVGAKLVIADIDIENLRHDRQCVGTFGELPDKKKFRNVEIGENISTLFTDPLKYREVTPYPFLDSRETAMRDRCEEISSIQSWGLMQRLRAINGKTAVVGISGGLDSTLALLVTVRAFDMLGLDRKGIIAVTMPGFGTTDRTHGNAEKLMTLLGVTKKEISISKAVKQHFADIHHDASVHDVTYENSQARERTQILMDLANKENGIVIGTGDLSELALGWCTYNGDQMSMYSVNSSVPKTLVKYLVEGYAQQSDDKALASLLRDIIDTPISPELLPPALDDSIEQKTEDLVGPYELHDFFLYHMLRYGTSPAKIRVLAKKAFSDKYEVAVINRWLKTFMKRFFSQQFKRSCMPDGVKVGSVCLSPRGDWRMPSDASSQLWLDQ